MNKTSIIIGLLLIVLAIIYFYIRKEEQKEAISYSESTKDKIAGLSTDDEDIRKYKDTAQKQIDYLISFMNEHDNSDTLFQYAVKSNFHIDGQDEHMWAEVQEFDGNYFIGTLANDPVTLNKLKFGDNVKVKKEDVEDWVLNDYLTNTKVGGFSQEYLRARGH
jgi:uncharacterized protein YegJ (DUF2314 family)